MILADNAEKSRTHQQDTGCFELFGGGIYQTTRRKLQTLLIHHISENQSKSFQIVHKLQINEVNYLVKTII